MKKKRISILTISLSPGGAERVVSTIANKLCDFYEVHLVLLKGEIFYKISDKVKLHILDASNYSKELGVIKFLKIPALARKYSKFLKEKEVEVSLSFLNRPNYINVLSRHFYNKSKIVISERIAPLMEYNGKNLRDFVSKALIRSLYHKANRVISNSNYIAYELSNYFNIDPNKIKVIYNPVDTGCKCSNCRKNEKFTFINVGRFYAQKNHKLLIEAFKKANLDAQLWLIGEGPLKGELQALVSNLGLKGKVKFLGNQRDVFSFLCKSHCFVLSSTYEGLPNSVLEALSCGLPVISTDCKSGPREILAPDTNFEKQITDSIEYSKYGILVPVGNPNLLARAMNRIYESKHLLKHYENVAKERAKDFESSRIIEQYIEVIEE